MDQLIANVESALADLKAAVLGNQNPEVSAEPEAPAEPVADAPADQPAAEEATPETEATA